MNFGRYTIWYNHEDHVWDIYDSRKGFKYPEYTINNYTAPVRSTGPLGVPRH